MRYSTIIFDWDGCLAQTLDLWVKSAQEVFLDNQVELAEKEVADFIVGDWLNAEDFGISDTGKFRQKLIAKAENRLSKVELYPGAKKFLGSIKAKNRQMALISSSLRQLIQPGLERHQLTEYFEMTIAGDEVKKHKPNPEGLLRTMEVLQAEKDETIMIGDSKSDLGAAQAAGIDSALFYPDRHRTFYDLNFLKEYQPDYIIDDWAKAEDIFF